MKSLQRAIFAFDQRQHDVRPEVVLRRTFLFGLIGLMSILTAGCATISPRNALPQASANQIEVEGFHNIRFWGDASGREIQAVMMADAPQTDTRRSLGPVRHPSVSN